MKRSLQEIAEGLKARLQGDGSVEVEAWRASGRLRGTIWCLWKKRNIFRGRCSPGAGAVIAGEFAAAHPGTPVDSRHPSWLSRGRRVFSKKESRAKELAYIGSAVVHAPARLANGRSGGEYGVAGAERKLARVPGSARVASIGRGVKIGRECEIYPRVTIYAGTTVGDRVIVHAGAVSGKRWLRICARREERAL